MRLRCEVAVPAGLRHGRLFVRLQQPEPDLLLLLPAGGVGDASHQLVSAAGLPLLTHLAERDQMSAELHRGGGWEPAESAALLGLARPGMTFADVGAGVGYYPVLLGRTLGPAGRVYAFEPDADNRLVLTANALLARQLCPQAAPVEVFPQALSDRGGEARLHLCDRNRALHSLVYGGREAIDVRYVSTATLDDLRGPEGTPPLPRRIDLLKADIQGAERLLLRGAGRTLDRDRPLVCLEFEPGLSGPDVCVELVECLRGHGYAAFRVFHATAADPYPMLAEAARLLTAEEVVALVRNGPIGPSGTLLAFPADRGTDAEGAPAGGSEEGGTAP